MTALDIYSDRDPAAPAARAPILRRAFAWMLGRLMGFGAVDVWPTTRDRERYARTANDSSELDAIFDPQSLCG